MFDVKEKVESEHTYAWFVRLDEDRCYKVDDLKQTLTKLMQELRRECPKDVDATHVHLDQFDETCDYKGFLFCDNFNDVTSAFAKQGFKRFSRGDYKSTSTCL